MKKRLLFVILTLALALSFALAACGEKKGTGSNGSASSAAQPPTDSYKSVAVSQNTEPVGSAEDDGRQSPASAEAVSSEASSGVSSDASSGASSGASSDVSSSAEDVGSSSAEAATHAPNPAYQDGDTPSFTISVTDTSNSAKTYSASCSYATTEEEYAYVSFFLPGGEYDVKVYEYNESKDKGEPLASGTFTNDIPEDQRVTIQVKYTPSTSTIEVLEKVSGRTQ